MTSSNKDAQYNSLQNAVRPPISAVAFLPETMHSEQSSLEKQRQVLQTWMSADNPFADLQ